MRPARECQSGPDGLRPAQQPDFIDQAAATKDDATRAPPSTISRVMPFSDSACSTAGRSSPGGCAVAATRITCAPAAPSFHGRGRFGEVRSHDPERRLARGMDQLAGAGQPQRAIQHHPHRRARFHPRQAAGQHRIIRQHGADADQDGVALRAQQMHARLRRLARDRDRLVAGGADLVVGGDGEFQDHMRALVADAAEMPGVIARGFRGTQADIDRDPGRAEFGMPLPGHFRIGVFDRRHHARNA